MPEYFRIDGGDLLAHDPDLMLPPDAEFADAYRENVEYGRMVAAKRSAVFVAICRNAMPFLPRTLALVEETASMFGWWSAYIYENDSTDGTQEALLGWQNGWQRNVSLHMNGRPHLNGTIEQVRTEALAEYRAACQSWVTRCRPVDYVIVFDTDPWGGWSVDGVATSIAIMERDESWYALASYSWCETQQKVPIHYDAFAARLNHWGRRGQDWFHLWHPPVGGPPVEFRSAFGQLAVYDAERYLMGTYEGHDCEHVTFHRSIKDRIKSRARLGLNPSSRCVSFWVPGHGWKHGDD